MTAASLLRGGEWGRETALGVATPPVKTWGKLA